MKVILYILSILCYILAATCLVCGIICACTGERLGTILVFFINMTVLPFTGTCFLFLAKRSR